MPGLLVRGDEVAVRPAREIAGAHQRDVAAAQLEPLAGEHLAQFVGADRLVRFESVDATGAGDIDQDAARDQRGDLGRVAAQRTEVTRGPAQRIRRRTNRARRRR